MYISSKNVLGFCCNQFNVGKLIDIARYVHNAVRTDESIFRTNWILNQLSKSGRIDEARQMFDRMCNRDEYSWNTMLSAYANSGRLAEAKEIFDRALSRSSITWSALISGFCQYECEVEAFELFNKMLLEGENPTQYTLGSILKLCSTLGSSQSGEVVHGYVTKTGFQTNVYVATALVDMYSKCNRVVEAECLFEMLPDKESHAPWTAMLTGYSHNYGYGPEAIEFFCRMRAEGVTANQFTFPSILTACAAGSAHCFGAQVHGCIIRNGFVANIYVQSALVDMYAKCGKLTDAKSILDTMETDDVISWNSMIVGCVKHGFKQEALQFFKMMHARDLKIDNYTIPSILNCFASSLIDFDGKIVHCLIIKTGFENYKLVGNALVDMYAKLGYLESALVVFNDMGERDVISWTSLVTGCTHNNFYERALKLFSDMIKVGISPDQFIIASILSACAELTVLELGRQVHSNFIKSGLRSSLSVENSLVTMYAKCGCLQDANNIFDSMQIPDVISWTALIVGYAQNFRARDSIRLYEAMISSGIKPDFITFIGLLFACSHAGLVEDGRRYFQQMTADFGIKPGQEHYACMIDLFGRSGKLDEAKAILHQMNVVPDATVWKALLAASRVHGDLELGETAAVKLFELEPLNGMPYVQLSNMYSTAGKWDSAAEIRKLMKSKGICKEPGCSWMEMNSQVHTFRSEDIDHPRAAEVYSKVDEIMTLIKAVGYVPDMSFALHDMDREGKERGLAYHSEKLAVALGLLTLPPGMPIRIFKNLRVCGDCHNAMKYISAVFARHIILRDSNCFHHFEEGKCSCQDYW